MPGKQQKINPVRALRIGFDMRKYPPLHSSINQPEAEPASIAAFDPDDDAIARLAYNLWVERGRPEGSSEEDWFRARGLLRAGQAVSASST